MSRTTWFAGCLIPLILLSACAGPGATTEKTNTAPPTTAPPTTAPSGAAYVNPELREARRVLRQAAARLFAAGTARFDQRTTMPSPAGPLVLLRASGGYDLSTRSVVVTNAVLDSATGKHVTVANRLVDGDVYVHAQAWPEPLAQCWVRMSPQEATAHFGRSAGRRAFRFVPNVAAVALARGEHFEAANHDVVVGTIPTAYALQMIAPDKVREAEPEAVGSRTYAWFEVADGQLRRWGLDGMELQQSLDEHDFPLTDRERMVLSVTKLVVTYERQGAPFDVAVPPPAQVLSSADARSGHGCAAG